MGLSTNTLLHQTSKSSLKFFINQKRFPLSYAKEILWGQALAPYGAFPMICFSDIPLSNLQQHLKRYDNYTIGMTREWAKRSGLNPVLYFEKESAFTQEVVWKHRDLLDRFLNHKTPENEKELFDYRYFLAFAKNYEEKLFVKKKNKTYKNYRFSDEREWRFVPKVEEIGYDLFYKNWHDYENNKSHYRKIISQQYKMPAFELTDINFIIVNEKSEIEFFYNLLKKSFELEINAKKLDRIPVNFFTNDQIMTDFM